METVLRKMADSLRRCGVVPGQERILAAVSGGADSLCLMLALRELGCGVRVLHVEHGIRGRESLEDARFVQQLCDAEKIPCTVEQIDAPDLARRTGQTLEEAARSARYRLLEQTARREGIRVIAAAHHMGDQAETVLWNLIRGSGRDRGISEKQGTDLAERPDQPGSRLYAQRDPPGDHAPAGGSQ